MVEDAANFVASSCGVRNVARKFGASGSKSLRKPTKSTRDVPGPRGYGRAPVMTSPLLMPTEPPVASSFDPRLESLRGLAALIVCVNHGMSVFTDSARLVVMDAMLLAFNSAAAVIFFFVRSGYVLGRALERDSALVPYLVRRLLRLFPAFVVMVLFAFACERLFRIDPIPSGLISGHPAHVLAAADLGCAAG